MYPQESEQSRLARQEREAKEAILHACMVKFFLDYPGPGSRADAIGHFKQARAKWFLAFF